MLLNIFDNFCTGLENVKNMKNKAQVRPTYILAVQFIIIITLKSSVFYDDFKSEGKIKQKNQQAGNSKNMF